ncbi:hypothetical protein ACFZDG_23085 [Kitasatospora xanthocidica]|uniref:hypothetical protein n=1 Tax=Kitasatospora xanthocidica TaxID=83382 RepID=UPI0036E789BA
MGSTVTDGGGHGQPGEAGEAGGPPVGAGAGAPGGAGAGRTRGGAVDGELCRLLGYRAGTSWGHLTHDGTVANLEAAWSARDLSYTPVAVAEAVRREPGLALARPLTVPLPDGTEQPLADLSPWQLVNLRPETVLGLPARLRTGYGLTDAQLSLVGRYTIQHLGYHAFRHFLRGEVAPGVILAPATMHHSWPKAAAVLGLGRDNLRAVAVDLDARADPAARRELLEECLGEREPVLLDVAVLGGTGLGAVDPLAAILDLRREFGRRGLRYPVHADATRGDCLATLRRPRHEAPQPAGDLAGSTYVTERYDTLGRADSISVDAHRTGLAPRPAGGLCYRDRRQRDLAALGTGVGPFGFFGSSGLSGSSGLPGGG